MRKTISVILLTAILLPSISFANTLRNGVRTSIPIPPQNQIISRPNIMYNCQTPPHGGRPVGMSCTEYVNTILLHNKTATTATFSPIVPDPLNTITTPVIPTGIATSTPVIVASTTAEITQSLMSQLIFLLQKIMKMKALSTSTS